MNRQIDNTQDIIDSRDVIARIEELQDMRTPRYVAGWNMPGYMPDAEPCEFDSIEDACEYIANKMDEEAEVTLAVAVRTHPSKYHEDCVNALDREAKDLVDNPREYSEIIGGYCYWIHHDGEMGLDDGEQEELEALQNLASQGADYAADWEHGACLIRGSYFVEYAQELADDIGATDPCASWPNNCIDWERAARELQMDYSAIDFDGETYWVL